MEELAEQLAGSFQVTSEPNSTAAAHPRFAQYKGRKNILDQNERRLRILDIQKQNRFDYLRNMRHLVSNNWKFEDDEEEDDKDCKEEDNGNEETMECDVLLKKPGQFYKNQLMLSEWLVEVPKDLEEEWFLVVCPMGKRCLVVASKGSTTVYTKNGYQLNRFPSMFPGGNRDRGCYHEDATILDCIYNELEKTYYILDVMSWNGHPMYDTETEFRFYWLHSKFDESPEPFGRHHKSQCTFVPLPHFSCTREHISDALHSANFTVDGVLFFHKRTHYTFGSTPLVVWLKPYMIPELLDISVPEKMLENMPPSYSSYAEHLANVARDREAGIQKKLLKLKQPDDFEEPPTKYVRNRGKKKKKKKKKQEGEVEMIEQQELSPGGCLVDTSMEVSGVTQLETGATAEEIAVVVNS